MSKRKCPIENCCNTDCHISQKEIIECIRVHDKTLSTEELQGIEKLKQELEESVKDIKYYPPQYILSKNQFSLLASLAFSIELKNEELKKQNKILNRALQLACDDLGLYEDVTSTQLKMRCYIDQAKKEMEE